MGLGASHSPRKQVRGLWSPAPGTCSVGGQPPDSFPRRLTRVCDCTMGPDGAVSELSVACRVQEACGEWFGGHSEV